jgi:3-oxoadipate enol-lactonase
MGSPTPDDAAWVRANMARAAERAPARPEAATRHQAAAFRLGWPELDALSAITADALVVHGTADRVLPVAHARALTAGIAGARLCLLDGMGHLATRREWLEIAGLTVDHLAALPA